MRSYGWSFCSFIWFFLLCLLPFTSRPLPRPLGAYRRHVSVSLLGPDGGDPPYGRSATLRLP